MLESLIIALREGMEAALVVGIIIVYLRKSGRETLSKYVYWGLTAAIAASITGAFALTPLLLGLGINEELYEGGLMLLAAAFVGSMLIWMWRTARRIREEIETKVNKITAGKATAWGLSIFTFLMVFREGVETLLFLKAVSVTTEWIMQLMGGLTGLALAAAFGVTFVKGSIRINLSKFFTATGIILIILILQLVIGGVHELSEVGVLPSSQAEMAIIGPIVNNNTYIFAVMLLISLIMVVLTPGRKREKPESYSQSERARRRKEMWLARMEKRWRYSSAVFAALTILTLTGFSLYSSPPGKGPGEPVVPNREGIIAIPISKIDDGKMHFFSYDNKGRETRFFILKSGQEDYRAGLDACPICGPDKGYYLQGQNVICRNCEAPIYIPTIGQKGGCNPIPLPFRREGQNLNVEVSDLQATSPEK